MTPAHLTPLLVAHVPVGGPHGPLTGGARNPLCSVLLYAGVFVAGASIAPVLLRRGCSFALERVVLASVSLAGVVVVATSGEEPLEIGLTAAHLVVVTLWFGAVVHLAGARLMHHPDELRRTIVRFTPIAVGCAGLTTATGTVLVVREHVPLRTLIASTFGALLALKVLSLLAAVVFGLGHRLARSGETRTTALGAERAFLAAALALGSALIATAAPAAAVTSTAPGVSVVRFSSPVSVFLLDDRGIGRLTLLSDESVEVVDRADGHAAQLEPGATTTVTLTRSSASVTVVTGQQQRTVHLPSVAALVPASPLLTTPEARAGWALGRVVGVRQAGAAAGSACVPDPAAVADALHVLASHVATQDFVEGSRSEAVRRLRSVAAVKRMPAAVYLAPSLLDRTVLTAVAELRLPPVTVAGIGDPMSPVADRYRAALTVAGGGAPPTTAGLLGYESAVAPSAEGRVALFAAAPIGFLPGVIDDGHTHADDDPWIPGGTLVATTRTLTVRLNCTTEELS